MNKHDNIMIKNKTLDQLKAEGIISQINTMIKNREIMDGIELTDALCERGVLIEDDTNISEEGYIIIKEKQFDEWTALINSGREEALKQNAEIVYDFKTGKPYDEKSPFDSDSEEVQKKRLDFDDFIKCVNYEKLECRYIVFDNFCKWHVGWYACKFKGFRKRYTKDMPNLHNITREKFEELVRAGYDCWDVEVFKEPDKKTDPRYDWERFKQQIKKCIENNGEYVFFDGAYFACRFELTYKDEIKNVKKIKIPKDICQERFIALVDEGYNVFEVIHDQENDPRYDWEDFKDAIDMEVSNEDPDNRAVCFSDKHNYYASYCHSFELVKKEKVCKIPKKITQERWIALVDKGYNVFEVTHDQENDPRYDVEKFTQACKLAIELNKEFVKFSDKLNTYVYSRNNPKGTDYAIVNSQRTYDIKKDKFQSEAWFKARVDDGMKWFGLAY